MVAWLSVWLWAAIPPAARKGSAVRVAPPLPAGPTAAVPAPRVAYRAQSAPAVTSEPRDARAQASALLDALTKRMRDALSALANAGELRRCEQLATPECKARLSDGLFEVLDGSVVPAIEAGELDLSRLDPRDSTQVRSVLAAVLESSSDPIERVAALIVLDRASQLEAGALPSGAFRGLAGKTVVEAQLLLMQVEHSGLPDAEAVREVAALAAAEGADSRVQSAALIALAHDAPALVAVVDALAGVHPTAWDGWSDVVAPALSRCGMACAEQTAQVVAAAADPAAIAERILRRCSPHERDDLLARIAPVLPPSAQL